MNRLREELPYHSTLTVRTSPNGNAEYRLEHPGSPRAQLGSPRPALKQSRIGRRVRFAQEESEEECDHGEEAGPYARSTPYRQPAPAPLQQASWQASSLYRAFDSQQPGAPMHGLPRTATPTTASPLYSSLPPYAPSPVKAMPFSPYQDQAPYAAFPAQPPHVQSAYSQQQWQAYSPTTSMSAAPCGVRQPSAGQQGSPSPGQRDQQPPTQRGPVQPNAPPLPLQPTSSQTSSASLVPQSLQAWGSQQPGQTAQHHIPQQQPWQQATQQQATQQQATQQQAAQQHGAIKNMESAQLQVQANTVSITVTAAQVQHHSPEPQQAQLPSAEAAPAKVPGAPLAEAAPAHHATNPAASGSARLPALEPAQLPKPHTTSSQTQTEAVSDEGQRPKSSAPEQQPTPPAPPSAPRLAWPLPAGIPARSHSQPASQGAALPSNDGGEGDLSYWGRTHMEESYYEDGMTSGSLSSGLSPRESRPRAKEWDHLEALQALAGCAETYSKAARQQKAGWGGPVTTTDALPARLAAQQLGSLAGMSRKVQEAILHSQRIFERQAQMVERAVLQRTFYAWKNLRDIRALRKQRQDQIRRRMQWSAVRRCMQGWLHLVGKNDQQKLALQKAKFILARHLLHRCFKEWARQCLERRWKTQLVLKDQQLQRLANEGYDRLQIRHMESRPVRYMQRYCSRRWLHAWREFAVYKRGKKQSWAGAVKYDRRQQAFKACVAWQELARWNANRRRALQRATRMVHRLHSQHCFSAWHGMTGRWEQKQSMLAAAAAFHRWQLQRRALGGWRYITWFMQTARDVEAGRHLQAQAAALQGWQQQAALARARRALLAEMDAVRAARLLAMALFGWRGYVEGKQAKVLQEEHDRLAEANGRLQAENQHLRQDHERLGRVIDSGEWGREQVAELVQDGEVLRKERDALLQLVESLRQRQEEADECSHLRITAAGISGDMRQASKLVLPHSPRPLSPCNSPPPSPGVRNKLLVKTGSSFNAMVRALKQDLITSGTFSRYPAATYDVDQLSMNRVGLKAGGEVEVEGLASPNLRGVAFGRTQPASLGSKRPESKQAGDLMQAALRLQSIGGRSVALGKRL